MLALDWASLRGQKRDCLKNSLAPWCIGVVLLLSAASLDVCKFPRFHGTGVPSFLGTMAPWNDHWRTHPIFFNSRLSSHGGRDTDVPMTRKRTQKATSKTRKAQPPDQVGTTLQIPPPPQGEGRENLSVEIAMSVTWRIQVALFQLQQRGQKTTKRAFVEELLVQALDDFDSANGGQRAA